VLLVCALVFSSLFFLGAREAQAGQEEWMFSVVTQGSMIRAYKHTRWGGGLATSLEYGFTDSWSLKGVLSYNAHAVLGDDPGVLSVATGGLNVVYTVDILRIVPYLQLGLEGAALGGGGEDWQAQLGVVAGAGLDYLLSRRWSLGVDIGYHLFVPDTKNLPAMLNIGFRITRRWY